MPAVVEPSAGFGGRFRVTRRRGGLPSIRRRGPSQLRQAHDAEMRSSRAGDECPGVIGEGSRDRGTARREADFKNGCLEKEDTGWLRTRHVSFTENAGLFPISQAVRVRPSRRLVNPFRREVHCRTSAGHTCFVYGVPAASGRGKRDSLRFCAGDAAALTRHVLGRAWRPGAELRPLYCRWWTRFPRRLREAAERFLMDGSGPMRRGCTPLTRRAGMTNVFARS